MIAVRALAPWLRRAGGRDQRLTTALAVTAFAVSTALTLSVIGGLLGFLGRAEHPTTAYLRTMGPDYVIFAWAALILLVVPLVTLGGGAARLGVARRDARLATLRLLGVTPREVVVLTVLETSWQGLLGAVAGALGYVALLPVWTRITFQADPFTVGELWVGWPILLASLVAVPLLAAVSGAVSLRRVVVSPLGVANRATPGRLKAVRLVVALVALGVFMVVSTFLSAFGPAAIAFFLGCFAVAFAAMNVVGPWVLGLLGRLALRGASTPARMLAARRLIDDPRAAWRVVGGLGLAGFVAGSLSIIPTFAASDPQGDPDIVLLVADLSRGAVLTLVITFVVAAASAGIAQAASVLDRRREYALAHLAGVPVELFDAVRRREVIGPMLVVSVGSAVAAVLIFFPLLGAAVLQSPGGLLLLVGCLVGGAALVFAATETSRPLLREVLAETVVRAG
ncbi:FtsX-like permease family protein [Pengzhenrongella phosphoraccumulans]|uniref:FtsX-like permease family protein n=1 Tax=Pengzhenrongella phosphoraccumulans TaxID=3114394 RepID=UPI00388D9C2A